MLCDLDALATLSPAEVRSGMAEVAKCGFIADPTILELIEESGTTVSRPGIGTAGRAHHQGHRGQDRHRRARPQGDLRRGRHGIGREALNYGHTLGHALERVHGYRMRHGEAISIGMVFAAELAKRTGTIDDDLLARHRSILQALGLPIATTVPFAPLLDAMRLDKKARGNTLRFVVLDGLGQPDDPDRPGRRHAAGRARGADRLVDPFGARRDRARSAMAELGADGLLVTTLVNVRYLTGFSGSNGAFALASDGSGTLFTDGRYGDQAAAECPGIDVVIARDLLASAAESMRGSWAVETHTLSVDEHAALAEATTASTCSRRRAWSSGSAR